MLATDAIACIREPGISQLDARTKCRTPPMDAAQFLVELGYPQSPGFLPVAGSELDLSSVADYGHIFRQAAAEPCSLQGVYALRAAPGASTSPLVPVVYVCNARTEADADAIHRLVWNQDVVPFLLVHTPLGIQLYSGFRYDASEEGPARGILRALRRFNDLEEIIDYFHADAIDAGRIWKGFGREVTPDQRVDWKLLRSLRSLDEWLRSKGRLDKDISHALIGKYVYLHYLRDRNILSQRKLASWGLVEEEIFGRHAQLSSVADLTQRLEGWLNGKIFPIDFAAKDAPRQQHLSWIAGAFAGDEVAEGGHRQLSFDFKAYDFSYIPIETLSVIYEQFLHTPDEDAHSKGPTRTTKGREAGAYYTPLPLVNFMLTEMEDRLPLSKGMTVFDPSCGSGAFLVQCYRRLIEKEISLAKRRLRPRELRQLLERHIVGVDRDPNACSITELSLVLTLLDYVEPPDLENTTFQLPALRGSNVFRGDFFEAGAPWEAKLARQNRTWIVGNPPWVKLSPKKIRAEDRTAWRWMTEVNKRPIGDNQVAQAFVWRVADLLPPDGCVGFLLPAMTLFEAHSKKFRSAFFEKLKVDAIANFANLAEVLFAGRSRVPAAAFFFQPRANADDIDPASKTIASYSPLVANQEATRPVSEGTRNESWSLVVNTSEVREIPRLDVIDGNGLPWKLAIWGSQLDVRILRKLERLHDSFSDLERQGDVVLSEGPQIRSGHVKKGSDKTTKCAEIAGKRKIDMNQLRGVRKIFVLPKRAIEKRNTDLFIRRGAKEGVAVCRPPHIILNAARRFAVYSDEFLIVPSRQIGIASTSDDRLLLKALSLYLSSDFAFYHQFLTSAQFGVKRDVATLAALRAMPVPLTGLTRRELRKWEALHTRLVAATRHSLRSASEEQTSLFDEAQEDIATLLMELNEMTSAALGLDSREQALVHDLVRVRLKLIDGKLGKAAVRPPTRREVRQYALCMKRELDVFVGTTLTKKHAVSVVYDELSGMIEVDLVADSAVARRVTVVGADEPTAGVFAETRRRLLVKRSQWVYFNRNLRLYEGTKTFVFKPLQRFHWTESQAVFDAREIIAETLSGGDVC